MPTGRTSPSDPKGAARGSHPGSPGHTSAADLAQGLKGADFPMNKKELAECARGNGASDEIVKTIQQMPDRKFQSMADVEKAFGQMHS
jgi:hypothetical protein